MSFATERPLFEAELDEHYSTYPTGRGDILGVLRQTSAAHPEWLPWTRKAAGYQIIARQCPVKVFRHFPFCFELDVGKPRTDLGSAGVGTWMKSEPFGRELHAISASLWEAVHRSGLASSWAILDDNHHAFGYDRVFQAGLNGLIGRAETRLQSAGTLRERAFLEATIAGSRAVIVVAERLAAEAARLHAAEPDPHIRARLGRMAATARRVPAEPPASFYEALQAILFLREVAQSLDGNGISVFGHLDRVLLPFYARDLAAGRLSREDAKDLLRYFLAFSDVRFGMRAHREHVGTNTTVNIGGCDAAGGAVFNDVTRMIVEAYAECRLVDPKLQARISARHPAEYFDLVARHVATGANNLCVFNDDVIIAANHRMGKALADCRLYVSGGCQESVLENTEVNSRATVYLNAAQVFLMGFCAAKWAFLTEREGIQVAAYDACRSFEELYQAFLRNLNAVVAAMVRARNRTEREGWRYNPCPLQSAAMDDCIERGLDMMEGGARYSFGSVSLTGAGTVIDSLFALNHAVFERAHVRLADLAGMLESDFAGEEAFRQYLLHRVPKFGHEDAAVRAFSARVFADLARVSSGMANTRGGRYEASLFSFRTFASFGERTGATPDGRMAGQHLSAGMSPSTQALGPECGIVQVLQALEPLDLTLYPVVAVLDLKLPAVSAGGGPHAIVPVVRRFLASGGSVLQMNCVDAAVLREAQAHPERHADLVVRISGYSAYFTTLSERTQDEIVARTAIHAAAG